MRGTYPEILYPLREVGHRLKRTLTGKGYPLHGGDEFNPFFIIGSGRSGTTLLRRILVAHPDIHIPPENHALKSAISVFRRNSVISWPQLVRLVLAQFEFNPTFYKFNIDLRPLDTRLVSAPEGSRSLAYILDSLYRCHGQQTKPDFKRWGDKTPVNTFIVEDIYSVFPGARFIHMLRDGVDVVMSFMEMDHPNIKTIEHAAWRWKKSTEAATTFEKNHPGKCITVRYEDLVRDPESSVESICSHLQIEYGPSMLENDNRSEYMNDLRYHKHLNNVKNPISAAPIGKGRSHISDEQKKKLRKLLGDDLKKYGYDTLR